MRRVEEKEVKSCGLSKSPRPPRGNKIKCPGKPTEFFSRFTPFLPLNFRMSLPKDGL